jgi:leucyl-tRNA synthetase
MAPSAPHLAEELWQRLGGEYSIHNQAWPQWDESRVARDEFTLVVQVNGKVRDKLTAPVTVTEDEAGAPVGEPARQRLRGALVTGEIHSGFESE